MDPQNIRRKAGYPTLAFAVVGGLLQIFEKYIDTLLANVQDTFIREGLQTATGTGGYLVWGGGLTFGVAAILASRLERHQIRWTQRLKNLCTAIEHARQIAAGLETERELTVLSNRIDKVSSLIDYDTLFATVNALHRSYSACYPKWKLAMAKLKFIPESIRPKRSSLVDYQYFTAQLSSPDKGERQQLLIHELYDLCQIAQDLLDEQKARYYVDSL